MPRTDRFSKHGGVITCIACGRKTRETGVDETSLQMCRFCIKENEWENALSDGDITQEEFDEIVAEINKKREVADAN